MLFVGLLGLARYARFTWEVVGLTEERGFLVYEDQSPVLLDGEGGGGIVL